MAFNIAVVDDQEMDRETLRHDIQLWRGQGLSREGLSLRYTSGAAMLERFEPRTIHLVFMDIYMKPLNGIETAKRLRAVDVALLIVFLTTSSDFAFDAFPVHPFDYIIKPYERRKVCGVLDEALRVLALQEPTVPIRVVQSQPVVSNGVYEVPLRNISAVVSRKHTVEICMADGQTLLSGMSFSEIESLLAADSRFLLCNRGLMVNMDQVASLNGDAFQMKNGSFCPIRVRGRAKTVADFSQYRIERMRGM